MADELDGLIASIRNVFYAEHTEEGGHLDASPELALVPIGGMQMWPLTAPPDRWLICNGQAVSRVTYNALFKVVGIQFGAGDGLLTFNVPNLSGRFPRGNDGTVGATGGSSSHSHSVASGGAHTHTVAAHTHPINSGGSEHSHEIPAPAFVTDVSNGGGQFVITAVAAETEEDGSHDHGGVTGSTAPATDSQGAHDHGGSTGNSSTLPPYVNVNYIIFAGGA